MDVQEPTLFGPMEPAAVVMPVLPRRTRWRPHHPAPTDRCDYCLLVREQRAAAGVVRSPAWRRTGVDGGVLLLCHGHADLVRGRQGGRVDG